MKKATKWVSLIAASAICVSAVAMLAACNKDNPETVEYTVTYYDGTQVLKTEKVKEGEKATKWTPTKKDYTFVDWFATPNFAHRFLFDEAITENKSAFAQWASAIQSADTRTFYIVGSGTSPMLRASNWGKDTSDQHKMTKAEGKNEYTYTLDLNVGDKFQFEISGTGDWMNQRGVGYLDTLTLENGTTVFSGSSTIGDNSSYRLDIKCEYAGNYTFTLTTHPDDDTYETNHPSYTEANKEAFNINPLDKITWVRNGEVSEEVDVITDYYIKGEHITDWQDMYNPSTKMTNKDGVYTLEIYLKENDKFTFSSRNTIGTEVSTGTEYIRASNLDEASKAYVSGEAGDMTARASGTYKFTYTEATKVLTVSFDAEKVPAPADYYLDGTFAEGVADWSGYCFNEKFKLTETSAGSGIYNIKNVALKADSQLIIQAFKEGSTERGEYGTEGYNGLGSYNYLYLFNGGAAFTAVGGGNNNIKVVTAGNYDITFNSYAKMITIESVNPAYDVYLSGTFAGQTNWDPNYGAEWKFTKSETEVNVYEITKELAAGVQFGVRIFPEGATAGDGLKHSWAGLAQAGTEGVTEAFKTANEYNLQCVTAGTYKISYNAATGVLNIYAVNA